jgi:hypothetical protein
MAGMVTRSVANLEKSVPLYSWRSLRGWRESPAVLLLEVPLMARALFATCTRCGTKMPTDLLQRSELGRKPLVCVSPVDCDARRVQREAQSRSSRPSGVR